MDNAPYLVFDVDRLRKLQSEYQASLDYTLELLPALNWNSPTQIRRFFAKHFELELPNVKIATLEAIRATCPHDSYLFELLTGVLQYFKLRSTKLNYIDCILRHLDGNRFTLRNCDGIWMLQNKRPLWHNQELWGCVTSYSANLIPLVQSHQPAP